MAISIRNPRAEQLAREVAVASGENLTQAIIHALEERLERLRGSRTLSDTASPSPSVAGLCRIWIHVFFHARPA